MKEKIILVTGGTSGIGKETVRALVKNDATVIFTAREKYKGEEIKREIEKETGKRVDFLVVDFESLRSVRELAGEFKKKYQKLHVLINNAGVMPQKREVTQDGHEFCWGVNVLAPYLLTELFLPILKESTPSRVINVSSTMHREGTINFEDLESEKSFDHYDAYAQSKLAFILLTKKRAKELEGSGVTINALHPGVVRTRMLANNMADTNPLVRLAFSFNTISPEEGAKTSVYLAESKDVEHISGKYFVKNKITKTAPQAEDMAVAEKLEAIVKSQVSL